MPTVAQIIKLRRIRQAREQNPLLARLGLLSGLLLSLIMVAIVATGILFSIELTKGLPSIETLDTIPSLLVPLEDTLFHPTRFFDRSHEHVILTLQNPGATGWQYLQVGSDSQPSASRVSQSLVNATLTAFDPGFWNEPGYTLRGITEGTHPTLAQQLVNNLLLDGQLPSIKRNIQERWLAAQLTARYGHEKVLEWYLNSAQYGQFVYGADAAARVYLGKPATKLSVAEAAFLTAIAESPQINPWMGGNFLRDRQVQLIQEMVADGLISADEAQLALKENIQLQPQHTVQSLAPALTSLALRQISAVLPLERIYRGGYDIITTLDYDLQFQAACTTRVLINHLQVSLEQEVADGGSACETASFLPEIQTDSQNLTEGIKSSIIVLEPQSGQILAWTGEDDENPFPLSLPLHPAGTILSPFLYLTAFTKGMGPATLLWDLPGSDNQDISRETLALYHGPTRLRTALVNDYLGAAEEVLQQVGSENVWLTEMKFGIDGQDEGISRGATLADLDSQPISLLDAVQAYGVLANQGVMVGQPIQARNVEKIGARLSPSSILSVEGVDGRIWVDWSKAQTQPIVSDQLAYLTTDILSDEKARSASFGDTNSLDIGRPVAFKVSINKDAQNAWTIGYIPQLAVGVWMGTAQGMLRVEMPTGLWHALMQYASSPLPEQSFVIPEGISKVQVCDPSGLLVSPICPNIVEEVFLHGNEPVEQDNLYRELLINRESRLLATIFTPKELVERKLFLEVPPEALDWANAKGLPIPPDEYDDISLPEAASADAQISKPGMFSAVAGGIEIRGTARGEGFSYYRLQVGQGLYPQEWTQIGEDIRQPVEDGYLGTWDTAGLNGIYVVELMVVRQDMRLERAFLQVNVDNSIPQVQILAPKELEHFTFQPGEYVILQVSVNDNLAVKRVEFYLDGELISTQYEPPYISLWRQQQGGHTLRIKAYDQAGNMNAAETSFSVGQ